ATDRGPRACGLLDGKYVDVNVACPDVPSTLRGLLALGTEKQQRVWSALAQGPIAYDAATSRLLPPIPDPGKIICIGLNYRDHAAESHVPVPSQPVLFNKYTTALIGHLGRIVLPRFSREVDYEAELVVVIGQAGRYISKENARAHVGGYTIGNDVSARDWQFIKPGKQWMAGKTFDTFAPTGPELVTPDEVPDPHDLGIRLRRNGQTMQDFNTRGFIFTVDELIAYISQIMTLEPGDLIFTGTPSGVGMARTPPVWLAPGDVIEIEIDRLGTLRNEVVAEESAG
ncbi:MAG: fumarylacetoacetate hydrolase family protein, partial [Planctomycetaceae bacterium]|nr:fumarylacetoacetate hydrolase family protein [Planctomycetaceae bacterium]